MATEDKVQEKPSRVALARREDQEETRIDLTSIDTKKVNLLVPTKQVKMLSPYHMATIQTVSLSPNPEDGDVYKQGSRNIAPRGQDAKYVDVVCMSKTGLMKLADAAGIVWNIPECKRLDDMKDRNYVSFQAVGGLRLPDGTFKAFKATKEIDMEAIEEEIRMEWDKKASTQVGFGNKAHKCTQEEADLNARRDILAFRKHKAARCETGAYNRVIRGILALQSAYLASDVAKPFMVPKIEFAPNYDDPHIRALTDRAIAADIEQTFGDPSKVTPDDKQAMAKLDEMRSAVPKPEWGSGAEILEADPEVIDVSDISEGELVDEKAQESETAESTPNKGELINAIGSIFQALNWGAAKRIAFINNEYTKSGISDLTMEELQDLRDKIEIIYTEVTQG